MKTLILIFAVLLAGVQARAQFFTGPISSATGGAGRAALDPSEAGLLNPASVAHLNTYNISGSYGLGHHDKDGDFKQWSILASDGSEGASFPGALSYVRRTVEPLRGGVKNTQSDIQLSLAELMGERIAFGVSAHRRSDELSSGQDHVQYNGHLGLLVTPLDFLGIGIVAYDIVPASDSVPESVRVVPTFALGSNLIIQKILHFRLDLVRPDKFNPGRRTDVMVGIDSYFRPDFAMRVGGLFKETEDRTFFTAGLGYKGPKLSFDYTFQKDVRVADSYRHLFDLWLPF